MSLKLRKRAVLANLETKQKLLLNNCLLAWKTVIQRMKRNRATVENFRKGANAKLSQKILFAFQRHLRMMIRKNFLKLEEQKTLAEEELEKAQGKIARLGDEKTNTIENQNNSRKIINELNEKIQTLEQEKVVLH